MKLGVFFVQIKLINVIKLQIFAIKLNKRLYIQTIKISIICL